MGNLERGPQQISEYDHDAREVEAWAQKSLRDASAEAGLSGDLKTVVETAAIKRGENAVDAWEQDFPGSPWKKLEDFDVKGLEGIKHEFERAIEDLQKEIHDVPRRLNKNIENIKRDIRGVEVELENRKAKAESGE